MKQIGLIIMTLFLIYSCNVKSAKDNKSDSVISVSEKSDKDSLIQTMVESDKNEPVENIRLTEVFTKAVKFFPNDSSSLCRFYSKWNATQDQNKIAKQINRLEKLTSEKSVEKYKSVENNLRPLIT